MKRQSRKSDSKSAKLERHRLIESLKSAGLYPEMIRVRDESGFMPWPAFFVSGYGRSLAINNALGTVWYTVTHVPSGMSFPSVRDYPQVNERTAWTPYTVMAEFGLLSAVAQLHFLSSVEVDWGAVKPAEIQHHCRDAMTKWEVFAFKTLEEVLELTASAAVMTFPLTGRGGAEA